MKNKHAIHIKGKGMKTYVFRVVIEPDEDRWSAHCPALRVYGAATWGNTQEEALKHIQEVVQMVVEELLEDGEPIPEDVQVSQEPLVAVTL
jgi:predicted RNase H-like HicB family nuclease